MRWFGLIGKPLTHSFSRGYFQKKFAAEGLEDCRYENFELSSIESLPALLQEPRLCGLNVTIPYKEQVLSYLHRSSDMVQVIGACNCIRIREGITEGFNTDVAGFRHSIEPRLGADHRRALVFGTGGASKAICYALTQMGIIYKMVSRQPAKGEMGYPDLDAGIMAAHTLLINTTPVGMYPDISAALPIPYEHISPQHFLFDAIYNPEYTVFLQRGAAQGAQVMNGAEMLVLQAEESWRIWNE